MTFQNSLFCTVFAGDWGNTLYGTVHQKDTVEFLHSLAVASFPVFILLEGKYSIYWGYYDTPGSAPSIKSSCRCAGPDVLYRYLWIFVSFKM